MTMLDFLVDLTLGISAAVNKLELQGTNMPEGLVGGGARWLCTKAARTGRIWALFGCKECKRDVR